MANGYNSYTASTTNTLGDVAPPGFHYMPDGTLMSDAEHARLYGEAIEENVIDSLDMDFSNISFDTTERSYTIIGSPNAVFTLKIMNEDYYWYNFETRSFQAAQTGLENKTIRTHGKGSIKFPTVGDADQYDIFLFAGSSTKHTDYVEARFLDNTIDLNSCIGSDSIMLQKVIHQVAKTTITLSAASKNSVSAYVPSAVVTTAFSLIQGGAKTTKASFDILVTAASGKSMTIRSTPTNNDLYASVARGITTAKQLPDVDSGSTSRRWLCSQTLGLSTGMVAIGTNVTAGSVLTNYVDSTISRENTEYEETIINQVFDAVTTEGYIPTYTAGRIVTAPGEVTFDKAQVAGLADDTITFIASGSELIGNLYGSNFTLSNVTVNYEEVSTTINDTDANGSDSITAITLTSATGIMDDVSTVSGINISPTAADPLVTNISTNTITINAGQVLENGQTLVFKGASDKIRIKGDIEITNVGDRDVTMYFDLERFVVAK